MVMTIEIVMMLQGSSVDVRHGQFAPDDDAAEGAARLEGPAGH
jgi:hypothetical protein